jgi:hypothetical protein
MQFTPAGTDSVGIVERIDSDRQRTVTFHYTHSPERHYSASMSWVRKVASQINF